MLKTARGGFMEKKQLSAQTVANYFLSMAQKAGREVTNKKLQKLIYYAQAWSLALDNFPLFKEEIEAWIHGPVVPNIYRRYKKYGYGFIKDPGSDLHPDLAAHKSLLDEIWAVYGIYDAEYLELLSHSEDPWIFARHTLDGDEMSSAPISQEIMRSYYTSLLAKIKARNALSRK